MKTPYKSPEIYETSFNCPHCKAFSSMTWYKVARTPSSLVIKDLIVADCRHCSEYSLWVDEKMIYPAQIDVEDPNEDLPEDIKIDYIEAAEILAKSPRGAAALLRLAIEKLIISLKANGKDLNEKIQWLVDNKGLNSDIQKSLDIVRVIGNNAVHPGELDLNDTPEIANTLFKLVNFIVEKMITEPREINSFYATLPEGAKEGIEKRKNKS